MARAWDLPLPSAITAGIMGHAYAVGGRTVEGLALLEETSDVEGALITESGDILATSGMRFLSDLPGAAWENCRF